MTGQGEATSPPSVEGGREIVLFAEDGREWAALLVGGRAVDLFAEDSRSYDGPRRGETCLGRIDRMVSGGRSAFVDLGEGRSGLLTKADGLDAGDPVLVQVDRFAIDGKAPRLTETVSVPGRWLVAVRGGIGVRISRRIPEGATRERLVRAVEEFGESARIVVRTAAQFADPREVAEEAEFLQDELNSLERELDSGHPRTLRHGPGPVERALQDWTGGGEPAILVAGSGIDQAMGEDLPMVAERFRGENVLLDYRDLAGRIGKLLESRVKIVGGGWMSVEQTSAVVAIDVNTGGRFPGRNSAEATGCAAARVIPGELRMRGLGGIVVVDFPPASDSGDEIIGRELERALQQDSPGARALGWTEAGLYEIIRTRDRRPLVETFPDGV